MIFRQVSIILVYVILFELEVISDQCWFIMWIIRDINDYNDFYLNLFFFVKEMLFVF